MGQRVEQRRIVRPMAARLHDHVLVEAEEIAQREELLLGRIDGCVFTFRGVGEFGGRPEHMAMRVHRARRRYEARLRRIGMEGDVGRVDSLVQQTLRQVHSAGLAACIARGAPMPICAYSILLSSALSHLATTMVAMQFPTTFTKVNA